MSDYIKREDALTALSDARCNMNLFDTDEQPIYRTLTMAIDIVQTLPAADVVSQGVYDQCRWERDLAIEQLASIGKGLGEKMDDVQIISRYPNDGTVLIMKHDGTSLVERKKGEWIWDDEGYHCSECFFHAYGNTLECLDGTYAFCPNCGADMRQIMEYLQVPGITSTVI